MKPSGFLLPASCFGLCHKIICHNSKLVGLKCGQCIGTPNFILNVIFLLEELGRQAFNFRSFGHRGFGILS
jgi:hypothetical protein